MSLILKDGRKIRSRTEFGFEGKIWSLLQMYHIKREPWFGGAKLNGVNYRRLMDQNEEIINRIQAIFIEMNEVVISEDKIYIYCDRHQ